MTTARDESEGLQESWGRFAEDPWPTGLLILRKAREKGLSRNGLAGRLGTADPGRTRAYLDRCVGDHGHPVFLRPDLVEALALTPGEIAEAREGDRRVALEREVARKRRLEESARASFRPHAWVIPESRIPSPVFVAAWYGQDAFRRVELPGDIASRPGRGPGHPLGRRQNDALPGGGFRPSLDRLHRDRGRTVGGVPLPGLQGAGAAQGGGTGR